MSNFVRQNNSRVLDRNAPQALINNPKVTNRSSCIQFDRTGVGCVRALSLAASERDVVQIILLYQYYYLSVGGPSSSSSITTASSYHNLARLGPKNATCLYVGHTHLDGHPAMALLFFRTVAKQYVRYQRYHTTTEQPVLLVLISEGHTV